RPAVCRSGARSVPITWSLRRIAAIWASESGASATRCGTSSPNGVRRRRPMSGAGGRLCTAATGGSASSAWGRWRTAAGPAGAGGRQQGLLRIVHDDEERFITAKGGEEVLIGLRIGALTGQQAVARRIDAKAGDATQCSARHAHQEENHAPTPAEQRRGKPF